MWPSHCYEYLFYKLRFYKTSKLHKKILSAGKKNEPVFWPYYIKFTMPGIDSTLTLHINDPLQSLSNMASGTFLAPGAFLNDSSGENLSQIFLIMWVLWDKKTVTKWREKKRIMKIDWSRNSLNPQEYCWLKVQWRKITETLLNNFSFLLTIFKFYIWLRY